MIGVSLFLKKLNHNEIIKCTHFISAVSENFVFASVHVYLVFFTSSLVEMVF